MTRRELAIKEVCMLEKGVVEIIQHPPVQKPFFTYFVSLSRQFTFVAAALVRRWKVLVSRKTPEAWNEVLLELDEKTWWLRCRQWDGIRQEFKEFLLYPSDLLSFLSRFGPDAVEAYPDQLGGELKRLLKERHPWWFNRRLGD